MKTEWIEYFCYSAVALAMFVAGWVFSASTIAHECERLGGFYVGTRTFKCTEAGK